MVSNSAGGAINNALKIMNREGSMSNPNIVYSQNDTTSGGQRKLEIVNIKTDVKLDGFKVGEAMTEIAVSY
jgi:hypothetical protein